MDAALKKAIAAAKAKGFDPEVELPPQQYAAHMRRWSQGTLGEPANNDLTSPQVDRWLLQEAGQASNLCGSS